MSGYVIFCFLGYAVDEFYKNNDLLLMLMTTQKSKIPVARRGADGYCVWVDRWIYDTYAGSYPVYHEKYLQYCTVQS